MSRLTFEFSGFARFLRGVRWNDGLGRDPRQRQGTTEMNETLETLPGEGHTETVVKTRMRHECDVCGEPAHYKHTFLLDGARRNPASSAYGRDDCSWCEDEKRFVCAEHKNERQAPNGYSWCSTFSATKRFAHMFLYWREKKVAPDDCPELFPGTRQALRDLCERPNVQSDRLAEDKGEVK